MTKKSSLIIWTSLLILVVTVMGCAPVPAAEPVPAPTLDMNEIRTEVAQIVYAELTAQAAANPTVEPTQEPTQAPQPAEAADVEAAATALPTFTPLPTATTKAVVSSGKPAPTQNTYTDQATLVNLKPANWTFLESNYAFDAVWVIKNTGKRVWNEDFYFKGVDLKGNEFGPTYLPNSNLGINDTVELVVDMVAPAYVEGGRNTHTAYIHVINDDGVSFFSSSLSITVQK